MTRAIAMTYKIAMAIAQDAAELHRRSEGRTTWNADDFACAEAAFKKCVPLMEPHERARYESNSVHNEKANSI